MPRKKRKIISKLLASKKFQFVLRLLAFAASFQLLLFLNPSFPLLKELVGRLVAFLAKARYAQPFLVLKDGFALQIVADCVGWKEIFVFLALVFSYPSKSYDFFKILAGSLLIFLLNILRLALLVEAGVKLVFDQVHLGAQLVLPLVLLLLFSWVHPRS